eukprot:2073695-Prymnesium_polylepis.1
MSCCARCAQAQPCSQPLHHLALPYTHTPNMATGRIAGLYIIPTSPNMPSVGLLITPHTRASQIWQVPFAGAELCEMRDAIARATAHGTRPFEPPSDSLSLAATRLCQVDAAGRGCRVEGCREGLQGGAAGRG